MAKLFCITLLLTTTFLPLPISGRKVVPGLPPTSPKPAVSSLVPPSASVTPKTIVIQPIQIEEYHITNNNAEREPKPNIIILVIKIILGIVCSVLGVTGLAYTLKAKWVKCKGIQKTLEVEMGFSI